MNRSAAVVELVPPTVVTVTSSVPVPAGAVAVICVALFTVKLVAAVTPKFTAVAPVKLVPVMVTLVPPLVGPAVGLMLVTAGTGIFAEPIRRSRRTRPPAVVAVTSTVPAPAGAVAVIRVALLTVKLVAAVTPKFTAVAPVKFVPLMVTLVPPLVGPAVGLMAVTVGAPRYT